MRCKECHDNIDESTPFVVTTTGVPLCSTCGHYTDVVEQWSKPEKESTFTYGRKVFADEQMCLPYGDEINEDIIMARKELGEIMLRFLHKGYDRHAIIGILTEEITSEMAMIVIHHQVIERRDKKKNSK